MNLQESQVETIKTIFVEAEKQGIPLWLDSGWSIDARLGTVTREHEDIDIVFPKDSRGAYIKILKNLGFVDLDLTDYGFIMHKDSIIIDSESCNNNGSDYEVSGYPGHSCPNEKQGRIDGISVRCTSWEKMYFEFLFLEKEVKRDDWKAKHFSSLKIIKEHISSERREELEKEFISITDR